ncbi:MAG TPA: sialidase family protein [Thermoanaerobaculia bacterium]|nr:sialidase family protein [Thermoanaerobaculia bacterium]
MAAEGLLGSLQAEQGSPVTLVRLDPTDPSQAIAVINGSLYKTTRGSLSLTPAPLRGPVDDVVVAPSAAGAPPTLYAAVSRQRAVWKSADGGAHWAPASSGLPRYARTVALALDLNRPSTVYLATTLTLYVSDDGANTWQPLATAGLPPLTVTSIATGLSGTGRALFAATDGGGAFVLTRP